MKARLLKTSLWVAAGIVLTGVLTGLAFAFYVAHFFVLHVLVLGLGALQGHSIRQLMTFPPFFPPGYGLSLAGVYAVWLLVVVLLYPLCRWMARLKANSRAWWLSYL